MPARFGTRRSVSLRAKVYARAREHSRTTGEPMSAMFERAVGLLLDSEGARKIDRDEAVVAIGADAESATRRLRRRIAASGIWTF